MYYRSNGRHTGLDDFEKLFNLLFVCINTYIYLFFIQNPTITTIYIFQENVWK